MALLYGSESYVNEESFKYSANRNEVPVNSQSVYLVGLYMKWRNQEIFRNMIYN